MDPEYEAIVLFTSTRKGIRNGCGGDCVNKRSSARRPKSQMATLIVELLEHIGINTCTNTNIPS